MNLTVPDWVSKQVDAEIVRQLDAFAYEAEIRKDLHPRQMELVHHNKWFRMFIPKSLGGLGLTLPDVVRLEEALAWADGSTGWVATLCGGAGWFVGFVEPSMATVFFSGDRVCIAGSGSATGIAEVAGDGFKIKGSWPYASGALHATTFTANCVIHEHGRPRLNAGGSEVVLPFLLKPDEVVVKQTWGATGMIATASHSFFVSDVHVPSERCFEISSAAARLGDPVYQYPFLQLAEATLAANISGMTVRFLQLSENCTRDAKQEVIDDVISKHQDEVGKLRASFSDSLDRSWKQLIDQGVIEDVKLRQVSDRSYELVRACRICIDVIYPLCKERSGSGHGELNRVWRNIDTALSHALFRKRLAVGHVN